MTCHVCGSDDHGVIGDHEMWAAGLVPIEEAQRRQAEAVVAERQRIKAAVEALATIGSFDTTGLHESKMVNRSHVLAIIDGEARSSQMTPCMPAAELQEGGNEDWRHER